MQASCQGYRPVCGRNAERRQHWQWAPAVANEAAGQKLQSRGRRGPTCCLHCGDLNLGPLQQDQQVPWVGKPRLLGTVWLQDGGGGG